MAGPEGGEKGVDGGALLRNCFPGEGCWKSRWPDRRAGKKGLVNGEQQDFELPELHVAPVPADYERLGFDAAGWNNWAPFECSPLVCNGEASRQHVNRCCLFDEVGPALEVARRYSGSVQESFWPDFNNCKPGTYCVVEVWRKAKPFPEPPRCDAPFEWSPDLLHRLVEHQLGHGNVFER